MKLKHLSLLLMLAPLPLGAAAAPDPALRDLTVVQEEAVTAGIATPGTLKVAASFDRAGLAYAVGEQVRIFVTVSEDAFVTVLSIGPTGTVTQLFPNKFQTSNAAKANQPLEIGTGGAKIVVGAPVGAEVVKVFATSKPYPITPDGQMAARGAFAALSGGVAQLSRDLAVDVPDPELRIAIDNRAIRTVATLAEVAAASAPPPAPVEVAVVQPPAPPPAAVPAVPIAVEASANPFPLVFGADKPVYSQHEAVTMTATPLEDCYLTVFDVNALGEVRIVFPNQMVQANRVEALQTVFVTMAGSWVPLEASAPGMEQFIALCGPTQAPVSSYAYDFAKMFTRAGTRDSLAADIGKALAQPGFAAALSSIVVTVND